MTATPEQAREIIRWGNRHRRMLRENYRRQFVAYNAPLLLGREVVFDSFDLKFVQADERIEFDWRGEGG
jgi:hypothetical protein